MGEYNRKGNRSGAQASEHAKAQSGRREKERHYAKRVTPKSHHHGRVPEQMRSR